MQQIVLPPRPYQKKGFSMEYITESGYKVVDTLSGLDVYDEAGNYVIAIQGVHVSEFMDENENIDDDRLDAVIETELEVDNFIQDQAAYM
jgi:hypothetical protein